MANEFIARNGLIALSDSTISGSLYVSGSITALSFTGSLTGTSSYATTASYYGGSVTSASYASSSTSASYASTASYWSGFYPISTQTGSYTLALADAGQIKIFNSAAALTVTVPPTSSVNWVLNTKIDVVQLGAGKVTFATGSGVTINSTGSLKSINGQYSAATLVYYSGSNNWLLIGNLVA